MQQQMTDCIMPYRAHHQQRLHPHCLAAARHHRRCPALHGVGHGLRMRMEAAP